MTIQVAIPADQFEYLSAKAVVLQKSLPDLVKNLLAYGRLTPSDSTPNSRASSFLPKGVKRLAKTAAK